MADPEFLAAWEQVRAETIAQIWATGRAKVAYGDFEIVVEYPDR